LSRPPLCGFFHDLNTIDGETGAILFASCNAIQQAAYQGSANKKRNSCPEVHIWAVVYLTYIRFCSGPSPIEKRWFIGEGSMLNLVDLTVPRSAGKRLISALGNQKTQSLVLSYNIPALSKMRGKRNILWNSQLKQRA
jgi:hypothetical protein